MSKVYILRGIPGSGKSTYSATLADQYETHMINSADFYFLVNGEYKFDGSKLPKAHATCLRGFTGAVTSHMADCVIVDNTNINAVEIAPYYQLAGAYGWDVEIVTIDTVTPEMACIRGIHDVPLTTVERMHGNLKRQERNFPPWWKHKRIENETPIDS